MELHIGPLSMGDLKRIGVVNTQFDTVFPTKMKQITGSLWTPEHQCWHIPYTKEAWEMFLHIFKGHTIIRELNGDEKKAAKIHLAENQTLDNHTSLTSFDVLAKNQTIDNHTPLTPPDALAKNQTIEKVETIVLQHLQATVETAPSVSAVTHVIAQRCAEQPNRIFLNIPPDRVDWKNYVGQIEGQTWHSADRLWSVPRTKELYQQFAAYFGDALVIDKENWVVLTKQINAYIPPQYLRFKDKLTVFEHPTKQNFWCLDLPKTLVTTHLQTVKNIQGRAWNSTLFVWEIPKTTMSEQFLDVYLPNLIHWDCKRITEIPTTHQAIIVSDNTPLIKQNTPVLKTTNTPYAAQTSPFPTTYPHEANEQNRLNTPSNSNKVIVRLATFWRGKLSVVVPYNLSLIEKIKMMSGKQWHADRKCWTLPYSPFIINTLEKNFGDSLDMDLSEPTMPTLSAPLVNPSKHVATVQPYEQSTNKNVPTYWTDKFVFVPTTNAAFQTPQEQPTPFNPTSNLTIDRSQQRDKFDIETPQYKAEITKLAEKMMLKRMAIDTIKTYKNCFGQFIKHHDTIHPEDITKDQIIKYMISRIQAGNFSETQQNNFISAIKCYYELVLGRERTYYELQRPKMPFQLPNILSESEIIRLFNAVPNIKHRCILLTIYSSGIRLSELTNLRIQDLRQADNCIYIKGGKGRKDRLTLLSPTLLSQIKPYLEQFTPNYWLFEGQTGGKYSNRSVQKILRDAVEKSGVNPFATVHTLRHSFATHLVLGGENLVTVQHLLGHEDLKTTEVYIHLTGEFIRNTKSPLDRLKF